MLHSRPMITPSLGVRPRSQVTLKCSWVKTSTLATPPPKTDSSVVESGPFPCHLLDGTVINQPKGRPLDTNMGLLRAKGLPQ